MTNYIQEFDKLGDKIPEFIVKLYHMLESKEYNDYICWYDDCEVLIKSGKKLEEKVLPHFFRHKHISSFIRQLNMYKFFKINKVATERGCMYFRNQHFKRGRIPQMAIISRNKQGKKKEQAEQNQQHIQNQDQNSDASINHQLNQNNDQMNENVLLSYKQYVKGIVKEITESLKKVEMAFPQSKQELGTAMNLCNQLLEVQEQTTNFTQLNFDDSLQNKNMLSTMRLLPRIESLIFPSQYSFCQFN